MNEFLLQQVEESKISLIKSLALFLVTLAVLLVTLKNIKFNLKTINQNGFTILSFGILFWICVFSCIFGIVESTEFFEKRKILLNPIETTATIFKVESHRNSKSSSITRFITYEFDAYNLKRDYSSVSEIGNIGDKFKVYFEKHYTDNNLIDLSNKIGFDSLIYKRIVLKIYDAK